MRPLNLHTQLAMVLIVATTLMSIGLGIQRYLVLSQELNTALNNKLQQTLSRLQTSVALPVYHFDFEVVTQTIHSELRQREIQGVLITEIGKKLPTYGFVKNNDQQVVSQQSPPTTPLLYSATGNLIGDNQNFASIEVFITSQYMQDSLRQKMLRLVFEGAVLVILLVLLTVIVLRHIFVRPIQQLTTLSQRIAQGRRTRKVTITGSTELAVLSASLWHMRDSIQKQMADLADNNEKLRMSEEKFRNLIESSSDWIWETNKEGVFTYASPQVQVILGYTPNEVIGKTPFDLMPPDETKRVTALFNNLIATGQPITMEKNINLHKDGHTVTLETNGVAVCDPEGNVTGYRGVDRDISDRKEAEKDQALIKAIFDSVPGMIFMYNKVGQLLRWNKAHETMTGYSAEELAHKQALSWFEGEELEKTRKTIENIFTTGYGEIDADLITKNGETLSLHINGSRVELDNKEYFVGIGIDITTLKETENELRTLRNYLANIIDSMPSLLVGVDNNGIITQWNKEATHLTGLPFEEAIGQPFSEVIPHLASEIKHIHRAIETGQQQREPRRMRFIKGKRCYEDVTVYPLTANGVQGAVIRVDDVTERMQIEEMMIQSEKMVSVGGLAAGMAHEINNPLGIIIQAVQNIERRISPALPANIKAATDSDTSLEKIHSYLKKRMILAMIEDIRAATIRAAAIVANMLQFSRRSESSHLYANIPQLIDQTIELAAKDYDLKKKYDFRHITIVREFAPDLPQIKLSYTEFEQVILNLLKNAAQAMTTENMSGRAPCIHVRLSATDTTLRLELEDNGPGMEDNVRKRIFEPFFTTKPAGSGTGLGLSVSYMIITNNHHGSMEVHSTPGAGTTFIITLPLN